MVHRRASGGARALSANREQPPKTPRERRAYYDGIAPERDNWKRRFRYYHDEMAGFHRLAIPSGASVLQIGCGMGELLAALQPARGVGVDFSEAMIAQARARFPELQFLVGDGQALPVGETYDAIVLSNVVGDFSDIWQAFRELRRVCRPDTRIIITYYNFFWEPFIKAAERFRIKMPQYYQNWLAVPDIENFLYLNGFEVVRSGYRMLFPIGVPGIAALCNRFLAKLPVLRRLCLVNFVVARPGERFDVVPEALTVSVIVPTRNEAGNVRGAVARTPAMGAHTEIIFMDGDSDDGTVEAVEACISEYAGVKDIRLLHQVPRGSAEAHSGKMLSLGKGDAVRKAFAAAKGDVLMILDGDLTVPPEDLPKFYAAIAEGRAEFINGTRLVYQMEKQAMRFLNLIANKGFSVLFTWLLEQRTKDTLCGTKVLRKRDYEKIVEGRAYFGDFDPFGDFDLLFGAARLNLRLAEVPIRYRARTYGEIKIKRWKHGMLLIRMSWIAFRRLKLT